MQGGGVLGKTLPPFFSTAHATSLPFMRTFHMRHRWSLCSTASVTTLFALACASAAPLSVSDIQLDGMKITIQSAKQTVEIAPLKVEQGKFVTVPYAGDPSWSDGTRLPGMGWSFGRLKPGSLKACLEADPTVALVEGKDYLVDKGWGTVGSLSGGKCEGAMVRFEYEHTLTRLDLVEQAADGSISVKTGKPHISRPILPAVTPGSTPLMGVYLPSYAASLTMDNINIIDASYSGIPPVTGTEHLAGVKAKLAAGKPVTIAFLGDSISAQGEGDFKDRKGNFVDRFTAHMTSAFPKAKVVVTSREKTVPASDGQIVIVKAGVPGDTSSMGLARIETDVLAHKPDAVVIMFGVNDENGKIGKNSVSVSDYKRNLETMADLIRAAGGATLIMTTSMKNRNWTATAGNLDEYAAAARTVAKEKNACLVDNFAAWELLPKLGYNYMIYLGTCINHPIDLAHQLFVEGLKSAFNFKQHGKDL